MPLGRVQSNSGHSPLRRGGTVKLLQLPFRSPQHHPQFSFWPVNRWSCVGPPVYLSVVCPGVAGGQICGCDSSKKNAGRLKRRAASAATPCSRPPFPPFGVTVITMDHLLTSGGTGPLAKRRGKTSHTHWTARPTAPGSSSSWLSRPVLDGEKRPSIFNEKSTGKPPKKILAWTGEPGNWRAEGTPLIKPIKTNL